MNTRKLWWFGVVAVLTWSFGYVARAAEQPIGEGTLAEMGLGGLVLLSDEDASSVRGLGYNGRGGAAVYGHSWANVSSSYGSAGSENGYRARGRHSAKGANLSFAGVVEIRSSGGNGGSRCGGCGGGGGPRVKAVIAFAGGASVAKAH